MAQPRETRRFAIRKGLDLRIAGAPVQTIGEWRDTPTAGLLGRDYAGIAPRLLVDEGDRVSLGQALFEDRRRPAIRVTAPASGVVVAINRGERRSLTSVVIERQGEDEQTFPVHAPEALPALTRESVATNLLASGLWTGLRTRPFGHVPDPETVPAAIFVTAIDTNPLAVDPVPVVAGHAGDFENGLAVLARLTPGPVFLCRAAGAAIPSGDPARISVAEFAGPHPAGLPGTHIHLLAPAGPRRTVWQIGYQDVIAVGKLFTAGRLWAERVVSLAGPGVRRPRLIRTRPGAATAALVAGELADGEWRVISGPVLSGHRAEGALAYLGRHQLQVGVLRESSLPERERLLDWIAPAGLFGRWLNRSPARAVTTALNGRASALIPVDGFERVIPLDILPVPLFRALLVGDTEMAAALGCLELDEEDLALATFLCPGKQEYGPLLRAALDALAREGA